MSANLTIRIDEDLDGEMFGTQAVTGIATGDGTVSWVFDQATASTGAGEVHHTGAVYAAQAHSTQEIASSAGDWFSFETFASIDALGVRSGIFRKSLLPGIVTLSDYDYFWLVKTTTAEARRIGNAFVSDTSTVSGDDLKISIESDGDVVWWKNGVEVVRREGDTHNFNYVAFFSAANEGDLATAKVIGTTNL